MCTSYDAYGNVVAERAGSVADSPDSGDRYKFIGGEFEAATALQYNRFRYYDPTPGRWLQCDALGFKAGDSNLHRYPNVQEAPDQ